MRLETQVHYRDEGSDVERNTINKLRNDLRLTEECGCDASAFYTSKAEVIDEVIADYQVTLKKLARL